MIMSITANKASRDQLKAAAIGAISGPVIAGTVLRAIVTSVKADQMTPAYPTALALSLTVSLLAVIVLGVYLATAAAQKTPAGKLSAELVAVLVGTALVADFTQAMIIAVS